MASMKKFLGTKLRLKINTQKSCVARVEERKFLGYRLLCNGKLIVAPESLVRLRDKVRQLTRRNRSVELAKVVKQLNEQLVGWIGYFRLTEYPTQLQVLDGWIRRKLRCYRLKQKKKSRAIANFLTELGVSPRSARSTAASNKGWWRLSRSPALHKALNKAWFNELKLVNLERQAIVLNT